MSQDKLRIIIRDPKKVPQNFFIDQQVWSELCKVTGIKFPAPSTAARCYYFDIRPPQRNENYDIPLDDPSLEDFFGYDLKADEERFDAKMRQVYKERIKLMVLKVLIKAHESDTGPIQPDEIRKRFDFSANPSDTEILEVLDNLQNEDWICQVPKGKGWQLTGQGQEWVKLQRL